MGRGQWGAGFSGTTIKDTWTKPRVRVVAVEVGWFGWGGLERWGENADNRNWTIKKWEKCEKKKVVYDLIWCEWKNEGEELLLQKIWYKWSGTTKVPLRLKHILFLFLKLRIKTGHVESLCAKNHRSYITCVLSFLYTYSSLNFKMAMVVPVF